MATSRLAIYNIALLAIGERKLDSLDEDRQPRRDCDEVWTRGTGAIKYWLEQGHWNFAMRAVKLDKSTSVVPEFGYSFAFQIPDDFVRLNMVSADERFNWPLMNYEIEGGYFYCDVDPLYLRFVSDDEDWGADLSKWPETFTLWAGTWMGKEIAPRSKNEIDEEKLDRKVNRLLVDARSKDCSMEPPRFSPLSSWAQARFGRHYRRDRGLRNKLIGN